MEDDLTHPVLPQSLQRPFSRVFPAQKEKGLPVPADRLYEILLFSVKADKRRILPRRLKPRRQIYCGSDPGHYL